MSHANVSTSSRSRTPSVQARGTTPHTLLFNEIFITDDRLRNCSHGSVRKRPRTACKQNLALFAEHERVRERHEKMQ